VQRPPHCTPHLVKEHAVHVFQLRSVHRLFETKADGLVTDFVFHHLDDIQTTVRPKTGRVLGLVDVDLGDENTSRCRADTCYALKKVLVDRNRFEHDADVSEVLALRRPESWRSSRSGTNFTDDLITNMELFLIENYVKILDVEEQPLRLTSASCSKRFLSTRTSFKAVARYRPGSGWCSHLRKIDIHKAEYPSSLWRTVGLVSSRWWTNRSGNKTIKRLSFEQAKMTLRSWKTLTACLSQGCGCAMWWALHVTWSPTRWWSVTTSTRNENQLFVIPLPILRSSNQLVGCHRTGIPQGDLFQGQRQRAMGMAKRLRAGCWAWTRPRRPSAEWRSNSVHPMISWWTGLHSWAWGSPYGMATTTTRKAWKHPKHAGSLLCRASHGSSFCVKTFLVDFYTAYRTAEGLHGGVWYSEGVLLKKQSGSKRRELAASVTKLVKSTELRAPSLYFFF